MSRREFLTRRAGRARVSSLLSSGYKLEGTYMEPNDSYAVTLFHPGSFRRLDVVVQPLFGLVLVKERGHIVDMWCDDET